MTKNCPPLLTSSDKSKPVNQKEKRTADSINMKDFFLLISAVLSVDFHSHVVIHIFWLSLINNPTAVYAYYRV